jgi:hypothetical protein
MKRHLIAITALLLVTAACGGASDGISNVIGPNPISDGRAIVHRATSNGWSSGERNEIMRQWREESGDVFTEEEDECVINYIVDHLTPSEARSQTNLDPQHQQAVYALCFAS